MENGRFSIFEGLGLIRGHFRGHRKRANFRDEIQPTEIKVISSERYTCHVLGYVSIFRLFALQSQS